MGSTAAQWCEHLLLSCQLRSLTPTFVSVCKTQCHRVINIHNYQWYQHWIKILSDIRSMDSQWNFLCSHDWCLIPRIELIHISISADFDNSELSLETTSTKARLHSAVMHVRRLIFVRHWKLPSSGSEPDIQSMRKVSSTMNMAPINVKQNSQFEITHTHPSSKTHVTRMRT